MNCLRIDAAYCRGHKTATQDPVKTAQLLYGKAVDSCFGGLTAPTTN